MTRAAVATTSPGGGTATTAVRTDTGYAGPFSQQVVTEKDPRIRAELQRLLDAARQIRPLLRESQAACEERGYYGEDVHEFFLEHGFYRMLQPQEHGGLEFGPSAFYQVIAEIARGCPSTAWCLSLGAGHSLTLGSYFDAQAQKEVWGEHGYMVCPASGQGREMTVTRVDGGWDISGTWRYASGAPYSTHFMATAFLPGQDPGDPERRVWMILNRKDFEIVWDWGRVIGMKGSGSQGITTSGAFVPDHHISEETWTAAVDGPTVGYEALGNPNYNGTFFGFAEGEVASTSVGLGYAAIDEYQRIITSSSHPWVPDGGLRADHQEWQRVLGMATSYVDAAQATLVHSARLYEEYGARAASQTEAFDESRSYRLNGVYFVVEHLVYQAMDLLLRTAGTQHSADGMRLQRYFRDALTTRTRTDQFEGFSVNTGVAQLEQVTQG
jgi:3-hydroxy-9,10-secoandrosta-1,3,5(10)-triene-9,17-dione monooxygenase